LGKSYLGSGALRTHPTGNYWFSVRYSCFYLADWKWFRYSHTSYFFFLHDKVQQRNRVSTIILLSIPRFFKETRFLAPWLDSPPRDKSKVIVGWVSR